MIAKNIKGKSFKGCVSYVMNETAELLEAEGVLAESTKDIISKCPLGLSHFPKLLFLLFF